MFWNEEKIDLFKNFALALKHIWNWIFMCLLFFYSFKFAISYLCSLDFQVKAVIIGLEMY